MSTIVLAYSGAPASSAAVPWLAERYAADVVTLTLDVGQHEDVGELRGRALACGSARAHVIDAREDLVHAFLRLSTPAGTSVADAALRIDGLVHSLIARSLVEVARIEGTSLVAHASADEAVGQAIVAVDPQMRVLAPAREWRMDASQVAPRGRARGLSSGRTGVGGRTIRQNLWGRVMRVASGDTVEPRPPAVATPTESARLDIRFESGVPVAVNGVPMQPVELIESLALIASQHGVGRFERRTADWTIEYDAPAAVVLHAARAAAGGQAGVVRLTVVGGRCSVVDFNADRLVTHA